MEFTAKVTAHQDTSDPERIRLYIDHPAFTDAAGDHPGLQIVFAINPRSADYSPNNFNRVYAELAMKAGVKIVRVKEFSRRLASRQSLIKKYDAGQV